ncbi:hypothetical protein EC844_11191 [Acinetobacter calcoaceticus]|uniref:Uncharacterized protein n=1 Tax=Acinetobacter calcoaceticus TaxID=471 RepID=A0A4R1XUI8_ACICA|nr:hypothetical protein EC844_11191 [Acinetobacter calcoaceticus]
MKLIEFMQQGRITFEDTQEHALALWNWNRLKTLYPDLVLKHYDQDHDAAIEFLSEAQSRITAYLHGAEELLDYHAWRMAYAEICFVANRFIDDDPWSRELLTEKLWPPFLAIDILAGILESSLNHPESQVFYQALAQQRRDQLDGVE